MKRKQKLNEILTGLCVTFDREFQPILVDVWDKALADLSIEEIDRAIGRWVAVSGKKFPVPVDIRELIQGDPNSNATLSLETLKRAMVSSGAYKSVCFTDEALMVAVENHGGWIEACRSYRELRVKEVSYWEHEFKQVYQQALKSGRKPRSKYLAGMAELHNQEHLPTFERGKLPPQEVEVYELNETPRRVVLTEFNQKALSA